MEQEQRKLAPMLNALCNHLISAARSTMLDGGTVPLTLFVANSAEHEYGLVPVPDVPDEGCKDVISAVFQMVAKDINADCAIVVMECWFTEGVSDAERAKYAQVKDMPQARDGFSVTVETHEGVWQATAEVTPVEGRAKGRSFGPMEFEFHASAQGRFVGLLPPQGTTH